MFLLLYQYICASPGKPRKVKKWEKRSWKCQEISEENSWKTDENARDSLPPYLHLTWPHLRCDVGLEEGEYRENCCFYMAVLCTIIMVHKGMSSSYRLVNCIKL